VNFSPFFIAGILFVDEVVSGIFALLFLHSLLYFSGFNQPA